MARKSHLKLFVWADFCPDYTSGLAFAIAEDETEARKLVENSTDFSPINWGPLNIFELNVKTAFCVAGGT